jgi:hypothetical protein
MPLEMMLPVILRKDEDPTVTVRIAPRKLNGFAAKYAALGCTSQSPAVMVI